MSDRWNIIFAQGATYEQTITMDGVSDIATATLWRLSFAMSNDAPFLTATTANGYLVPTGSANERKILIPASITDAMPLGNGRFDFEIEWAGPIVRRYVSNGYCQVNPPAGTT